MPPRRQSSAVKEEVDAVPASDSKASGGRVSRRASATPTPSKATKGKARASSAASEVEEVEKAPAKPARASKAAATPAKEKAAVTPKQSAVKAAAKSTGKRGRNDDSQVNMNDAAHISTSNQAENKKSKGKQLSAEEQEEIVTNLKSLSSINGLEVTGEGMNSTNDKGETYLHFAAFNAEPQLVKWLIEKGADCNLQDEKGRTALSRCASGDHQCVKMLLHANADVDLPDKDGISPLHYASLSSSFDNVNLMLQYEALVNTFDKINGSSPLHDACFSGSLKCVKALVEAGAQVDMPTKSSKDKNKGAVALHYAAQENRHDIVEYLIRQSAGVNIQDARGCTPLHYAVYTGSVDVVRVLLKNKADAKKPDAAGRTAEKLMEMSPVISKDSSLRERMMRLLQPDPKKDKQNGCVIC